MIWPRKRTYIKSRKRTGYVFKTKYGTTTTYHFSIFVQLLMHCHALFIHEQIITVHYFLRDMRTSYDDDDKDETHFISTSFWDSSPSAKFGSHTNSAKGHLGHCRKKVKKAKREQKVKKVHAKIYANFGH